MPDSTGEYGTLKRLGYRVVCMLGEYDRLLFFPQPTLPMEQVAEAALDKALSLLLETVAKKVEAGKRLAAEDLLAVLAASNRELMRQIGQVREEIGRVREELVRVHERIDETNKRIDEMNKRIDETNKRIDDLQKTLVGMQAAFAERIDEMNKRIDETNKRIDETNKRIDDLQKALIDTQATFNKRVDELYNQLNRIYELLMEKTGKS